MTRFRNAELYAKNEQKKKNLLTVSKLCIPLRKGQTFVPFIRISNQTLKVHGFNPGARFQVQYFDGLIILKIIGNERVI